MNFMIYQTKIITYLLAELMYLFICQIFLLYSSVVDVVRLILRIAQKDQAYTRCFPKPTLGASLSPHQVYNVVSTLVLEEILLLLL